MCCEDKKTWCEIIAKVRCGIVPCSSTNPRSHHCWCQRASSLCACTILQLQHVIVFHVRRFPSLRSKQAVPHCPHAFSTTEDQQGELSCGRLEACFTKQLPTNHCCVRVQASRLISHGEFWTVKGGWHASGM